MKALLQYNDIFVDTSIVFFNIDAIFIELYRVYKALKDTTSYTMIKSIVKTTILIAIMCFTTLVSKAQSGDNYAQFDVGAAGAYNSVKSDVQTAKSTISPIITFNYNQTPFINYLLEIQAGKLEGGDSTKDALGRQFTNSYTAVYFRIQLQMGEIIDYSTSPAANAFKNFYISSGVGYLINHITNINRTSLTTPIVYTPGLLNSTEIVIPLRVGYEFKIFNDSGEPTFKIDIGYQENFVLGDELDGFAANKNNDSYSQFTLGLKYSIGSFVSYRKHIYY